MDPITHTLVGAALGEAGLRERTALGMPTLLIGANLPDVDVLSYAWGDVTALGFRRGWTHGVLAMAVLPVALAGIMLLWDRLMRRLDRRREPAPGASDPGTRAGGAIEGEGGKTVMGGAERELRTPAAVPARAGWLLILAGVSVWTHPFLDFLNTYGMRLLFPLSERWFYGDAVFIVDPWIWAALTAGVVLTRRRSRTGSERPCRFARLALGVVGAYIVVLLVANVVARRLLAREMARAEVPSAARMMVAPVPVNPFQRVVVLDVGPRYEFGSFAWIPAPRFTPGGYHVDKGPGDAHPAIVAAGRTPEGRAFLRWARFPYFRVERGGDSARVHMGDARYTADAEQSWAAVTVVVACGPGSAARHSNGTACSSP